MHGKWVQSTAVQEIEGKDEEIAAAVKKHEEFVESLQKQYEDRALELTEVECKAASLEAIVAVGFFPAKPAIVDTYRIAAVPLNTLIKFCWRSLKRPCLRRRRRSRRAAWAS